MNILTQMLQKRKEDGINQGFWIYNTFDDEFICCTERTIDSKTGKKQIRPWIIEDFKVKNKFISGQKDKPIYNLQFLKKYPEKYVLIVEGEKTADATSILFPEFNVITWMGGCQSVKNVDFSHLKDKTVYLLPDNDEVGYKAMELIRDKLIQLDCKVHFVDIKRLGVEEGWDVADLDEENGCITVDDVKMIVNECKEFKKQFDFKEYPHMSEGKNPKPLDTTENLQYLLNHFNIKVKWNMMNRGRDVVIPNVKFYYEESENLSLTYITDLAVLYSMPTKRIDKHLDAIASKNCYHPICDWILSKKLTDKGIFSQFLTCIKTTNDELSYILIKRWMISAVAAAFSEGDFAPQGVLVIHGEQYTHKSSFIMSLAPKEFKAIKGGLILDPSRKDDVLTASQYWIGELAELDATFKKADSNRLKGFINLEEDSIRRPYAAKDSKLIRRTVFAATVNESKFLIDTTGNRRWWTISITQPINTRHELNMQQVWREIYEMYLNGESANLSKQELLMLNNANEKFEYIDPFKEKFTDLFYDDRPPCQWMSASQILSQIGYDKPTSSDLKRMGDILSKMKWEKGKGRLRYSYYVPQLKPYNFKNA